MRGITHYLLRLVVLLMTSSALTAARQEPVSEETLEYFQVNCASCHTIGGGRLAGPDLKGVSERREFDWLTSFIQDPAAVIQSGDPYALELLSTANGVVMPTIPGLDRARAQKLIEMIRSESALEKSRFAGLQLPERPLTEADVARGWDYFLGAERFQNGGPPCASCHTMAGIGGLGGGLLGPDLSAAYGRLEGRKALGAWLASPPSPVMQPVFKGHALESEEILALVAAMKGAAESGAGAAESRRLPFILVSIGLAALLMVLCDLAWKTRFRSVRRALVENN